MHGGITVELLYDAEDRTTHCSIAFQVESVVLPGNSLILTNRCYFMGLSLDEEQEILGVPRNSWAKP